MNAKRLMTIILSVAVMGWATAARAADLGTVVKNPARFINQRIEITAPVVENSDLEKGEFKRWTLTLGEANHTLAAQESGFNPLTILVAHKLVEEARNAGAEITAAGTLKDCTSGLVLKLDWIRYGGTTVHTDWGPFVDDLNSEGLPWTPLWYDGIKYYPGEFPL
jgi:hypothetical protein